MINSNKDILKQLKEEADYSLFESLVFNNDLKDKVRKAVKHSENSRENNFLFILAQKKLVISSVFVAATICLVFVSIMIIGDSLISPQKTNERTDNNYSTFQNGGGGSNLISGPNTNNYWELNSKEEVRQMFNNEVLVPNYVPEHFKLNRIHALGVTKEDAKKVVFTYTFDELSYLVIVEKGTSQFTPKGYEKVNINGRDGYIKTERSEESMNTDLLWNQGDYHYIIGGLISSEVAIKVAKSMN